MMAFRYLGPSDVMSYKDSYYHVGDNIPMTKDEVEHMAKNGHRFEGVDSVDVNGTIIAYAPVVPPAQPFDDRGQQIALVDEHGDPIKRPAPVSVASVAAATAAPKG